MANELFNENTPNEPEPIIDEAKKYFEELVGEGKKFKDPEALARKAIHADTHITRLEEENRLLREQTNQSVTLKEFLDRMEQERNNTANLSNENNQRREPDQQTIENKDTLTKEQVAEIVKEALRAQQQQTVAERNLGTVVETLRSKFGANYVSVLKERTKALGLSEASVETLAKEQPKAVFALLGIEEQGTRPSVFTPPDNAIRSPSSATGNKKNHAYYEAMRKNPATKAIFESAAIQRERFEMLKALGPDEFYK